MFTAHFEKRNEKMINCTYVINKRKLYVYCEVEGYCKQIEKWLSVYNVILSSKYDFYIKIYKNMEYRWS